MSFKDKVILVTGTHSEIATDAAREFAKAGGKVVLAGQDDKRLDKIVNKITQEGGTAFLIIADVEREPEKIIKQTIDQFQKLHVLVNFAGLAGTAHTLLDADYNLFDQIMNANLRSTMVLSKHAAPHLKSTKGNIINVSSIAALIVLKGLPFYSISQAALDKFTDCAALEFGKMGIRVNAINQGAIRSVPIENLGNNAAAYEKSLKSASKSYPISRIGELYDTSAAILFLASDAASFITGTHLRVDGGAITAGAF